MGSPLGNRGGELLLVRRRAFEAFFFKARRLVRHPALSIPKLGINFCVLANRLKTDTKRDRQMWKSDALWLEFTRPSEED